MNGRADQRPFRLGLTGSIGTGKTSTAALFAAEGCPVWDADAAVHRLYGPGGAAVAPVAALVPEALRDDGAIDRAALRDRIAQTPELLGQIEAVVHPLVAADRARFLERITALVAVFDIPLLFETGADSEMDAVACTTISPAEQRRRVLARGTMSAEDLETILARQMPAAEKCRRADYVIETDTPEHARRQVRAILEDIARRRRPANA